MPLVAIINESVICIHGGISPNFNNIEDVEIIDRRIEVPHEGIMCDLLWSDPDDIQSFR